MNDRWNLVNNLFPFEIVEQITFNSLSFIISCLDTGCEWSIHLAQHLGLCFNINVSVIGDKLFRPWHHLTHFRPSRGSLKRVSSLLFTFTIWRWHWNTHRKYSDQWNYELFMRLILNKNHFLVLLQYRLYTQIINYIIVAPLVNLWSAVLIYVFIGWLIYASVSSREGR